VFLQFLQIRDTYVAFALVLEAAMVIPAILTSFDIYCAYPSTTKTSKSKREKQGRKKKTLKSGGKKTLNALFGYLENVDKNQSFQSHILIEKRKKKLKPYNIRFNFLCFLHSTYFFLSFPQFSNQPSGEKNKK